MKSNFATGWIVAATIGLMAITLTSEAKSESGIHVKSGNAPATLNAANSNCYGNFGKSKVPGADYVAGRQASGGTVQPADIPADRPEIYPVVRFDLGLGKHRRGRRLTPGPGRGRLRANNLSVGEVSIDTRTGEVALDGQPLTSTRRYRDCETRTR